MRVGSRIHFLDLLPQYEYWPLNFMRNVESKVTCPGNMKYCVFVFMMYRPWYRLWAEDSIKGCLRWYRIRIFLDRLPVEIPDIVWQGSDAKHFLLLFRFNFVNLVQNSIPSNFGSGEFLFHWYETQDAGVMEGIGPVLQYRSSSGRSWRSTCPGVIALGSHRGWGETPFLSISCSWAFPMKIELFSYDTRFFFTRHHLRWLPPPRKRSPPRRISNKQFKKTLPVVPRRGLKAGLHQINYDFHGSGVNHIDSCLFLQSPIFYNMPELVSTASYQNHSNFF